MKASDLLVRALENEGVDFVFALPGEENLDVLESLRTSQIKTIVCRHEQAAGFMAATIGRLTGKAGVVLSTLGPGATNLVTPAAYATLGGMPMVMVTGQKPIKKSKQGAFQIIDVVDLMRPVTKFTKQIGNANILSANVREAFRLAQEERPGAVHLELPEDIAAEDTEETNLFSVDRVRRPVAEEKAIAKAVEMISQACHPLLLVGAGANRKMTSKMVREFMDKICVPAFCTQMGKGVIDERSPLFLGCAAFSQSDFVHEAVEAADLIINVGHDVVEKPPFIMRRDGAKVIHVNFYSAKVDTVYFPQLEVIGDIANAMWQLKERLSKDRCDAQAFVSVKERYAASAGHAKKLIDDIRAAVPDDGLVALDNGIYKIWFARYFETRHPNSLLLDNALATMGAGLPSAMAAKLLEPKRPVLCVSGDGGFLMNAQELETAARLKLDLVILVLNDNGYGMIEWKQQGAGFSPFGLKFGNPDFVKFAESHGAHGYRVNDPTKLREQIEKCFGAGGIHLIEFPIDYAAYHYAA